MLKILCAMWWILMNPNALAEETPKFVLNWSSATWHWGSSRRPKDDAAEYEAIALRTTNSSVQMYICHSYVKHSKDSNIEYSPLFHNIQIDVHFLSVPFFRFTSSVSSSQQKFASEISPSSLQANNNSEGLSLGFLFTLLFKTIELSSFHYVPYIEWGMVISFLIKLHLLSYFLHES
jgi:hypothetical protein